MAENGLMAFRSFDDADRMMMLIGFQSSSDHLPVAIELLDDATRRAYPLVELRRIINRRCKPIVEKRNIPLGNPFATVRRRRARPHHQPGWCS